MKLKKNVLKMCIHTFFYPICSIICAIIFIFVNKDLDLFWVFIFIASMCLVFNIRFIGTLILLGFDVIFKNICSETIKIDAIDQNLDMASISFNKPTLIDLFDNDSLFICNIYVDEGNRAHKLKLYGNKLLFKEEIESIVDKIAYPRYKKYDKTQVILKAPGKHTYKVIYYNNSNVIKCIAKAK